MRWPIEINPKFRDILFHLGVMVLVTLLGMVIYRNSLDVPFVFDDVFNISENNAIRNIFDLPSLWHYDPSRFLTHYTFALNFHFSRLDVFSYHLVNLIVHLGATWAGYLFVRLVLDNPADMAPPALAGQRRRIAVFAALLFLCHPIQTQAVTYISQRSTPLAALCYLSALIFYVRYRQRGGWKNYAAALGFAFTGLFTKPIIVTLPLAMILCEVFFLSPPGVRFPKKKSVWAGLLPFFSMLVIVPILLMLWRDKTFEAGDLLSITRESDKYSRGEYFLTQLNVIVTYLRLLFWPVNQKLDYDFPIAAHFFGFPTWLSFLAIAALFYLAIRIFRKHKIVSFGLFWIFVTLSLESSIFPISDVIFEHRLYLPMAGFALMMAYGLAYFSRTRPAVFFIAGGLIISVLGTLTYRRNEQWRDAVGFYQDMAEEFPNKARILNNLGNYYAERKEWQSALKAYEQALPFANPVQDVLLYNNIANVYGELKQFPEAIVMLEKAITEDPSFEAAHYNLGLIYSGPQYRQYELAKICFDKTLELNPGFAPALVGIASVYSSLGEVDKARFYLEQAQAVNPGYAPAYQDLGHLYLGQKQYDLAFNAYKEAVQRNSNLADVHNNLGNLYMMQGKRDEALSEYQQAIRIDPEFRGAYKNMGDLYKMMGRLPEAKAAYQKALDFFTKTNDGMMMEQIQAELKDL